MKFAMKVPMKVSTRGATRAALLLAAAVLAGCTERQAPPGVLGDPQRGGMILTLYACHSCHIIPGTTGPETWVGRPLDDLAKRKYIAGELPNNQANLVRWIRHPQSIDPNTAMPDMGVSERDALDISAYLLSQ